MQRVFEKIIERLEEKVVSYELNCTQMIREKKCQESADCGMCAFKQSIEIVNQVASEYGEDTKHLPAEYNWIPFEQREMDEEELRCLGEEVGYILDCPLPDEDEEILVTYANGTVGEDIFLRDGNECYLDSGNEFVTEAIAWRKKPEPYKAETHKDCSSCANNTEPDEIDNGCYMCCKGLENNYEPYKAESEEWGMTNAGKIRTMSDEELAEFLPVVTEFMCRPTKECRTFVCNHHGECANTKECAMKWLQSEVEE